MSAVKQSSPPPSLAAAGSNNDSSVASASLSEGFGNEEISVGEDPAYTYDDAQLTEKLEEDGIDTFMKKTGDVPYIGLPEEVRAGAKDDQAGDDSSVEDGDEGQHWSPEGVVCKTCQKCTKKYILCFEQKCYFCSKACQYEQDQNWECGACGQVLCWSCNACKTCNICRSHSDCQCEETEDEDEQETNPDTGEVESHADDDSE